MPENDATAVTIKVRDGGPYLVTGAFTLTDADGNAYALEGPNTALCRCGASQNKPFCDGTHKQNGFDARSRAANAGEGA
ncbi:MAG TPA: CDGSH iron-sulfur domain-containing protein [Verrucomicrobiae bacterium]|nr:CDGSH iron-sulfur domain-containing protein [Verrucomicrobiae bacterium]